MRETHETIAGCRTRIMRGGEGAPLLFLHGAGGVAAWLPFMERLAQDFDVIVPEHPGFGGSEMPDWLDNVGDLAYFYLDLIEQLGFSQVHLAGISIGGWVACEIAIRDRSELASLTLMAAHGLRIEGLRKADTFLMTTEELTRSLFHDPALAESALARVPSDEDRDVAARNRLATAKLAWDPRFYNPHLDKWLHRILTPTLILWGEHDRLIPPAYGEAFASRIPGARLQIVAGSGHSLHIEKADAVAATIADFARGV